MKKIIATLALGAFAGGAFAQGTVAPGNTAGTPFQTNSIAMGGTSGTYVGSAGLFDFEVLTAPSTVTTVDSSLQGLLTSTWSDTGILGVSASFAGRMGSTNGTANNWAPGVQQSYIVIGWSASIGNFATLEADLSGASLVANGSGFEWTGLKNLTTPGTYYIGATAIGSAEAGGGASGLPPFGLFGSGASAQGTPISTATELYIVSIPEPTTFALAGLGAAAMLIFRRRK
jgi:hypothetical protein